MQRQRALSHLQSRHIVRRVRLVDDSGTSDAAICIALPNLNQR